MPGTYIPRKLSPPSSNRTWQLLLTGLLGLLAFSTLIAGLAACGSTDGKIHLTMWYWNRSIDDALIAQVDKVFPNVVLTATKVTDYDIKVRTAMAGQTGIPDILGINSNIATYFPDEDQFVDLRAYGAGQLQDQYLPWKWKLGIAPDGKMIGFPMDTGPTALFYREDIFAKAGLPSDPAQVAAQIKTWDDYFQAGVKLKNATHSKSYMLDTISTVFIQMLAQSPQHFFDPSSGRFIADQPYMQRIWNEVAKARASGISSVLQQDTPAWDEGVSNGYIASFVSAVWRKQILQEAASNTAGKWRIAPAPGGAGNNGGSFLAVTAASQHPKEAFEVIKWLQSPQNQLTAYRDLQLYPSAVSALDSPVLSQKEAFYGGQDTTAIFSASAKAVPSFYMGPYDSIMQSNFTDQVNLIEYQGKSADRAWNDAQANCKRELLR